jgi:4-amino-4-deoxy-L-arabinose transferase-like glycosyltransferase
MQPAIKNILAFLFIALLAYFSLFHQLGKLSLRNWDEASYALNAWEMLETGEYINLYQFGKADFYNTKPPFAIWCMALSMKAGGIHETAVRLPAAFFGFLSVCWVFVFCLFYLKNYWAGVWSACILMTSKGFVAEHAARTGDTDAILAFFILFYLTIFYAFIIKQKARYIWLCAAGMVLACLTKGIAGLQGLPALAVLAAVFSQWKSLLNSKHFYAAILVFIFIVGGYYLWRELKAPDFLSYVIKFEIGGRLHRQEYLNPESRGFFFYLQEFYYSQRWWPWIFLLVLWPIALIVAHKNKSSMQWWYLVLAFCGLYLAAGISSTKNFWYDVPLYPLLALVTGYCVSVLFQLNHAIRYVFMLLFAATFIYSYANIVNRNLSQPDDLKYKSFFSSIRQKDSSALTIVNADFIFPINFYQKLDAYRGFTSYLKHPDDYFVPGEKIIVFKEEREADMKRKYSLKLLMADEEAKLFAVVSILNDSTFHKTDNTPR